VGREKKGKTKEMVTGDKPPIIHQHVQHQRKKEEVTLPTIPWKAACDG
jgi:hypothetical protein